MRLFAVVGALVAVALASAVRVPIGPFTATLSVRPAFDGRTIVRLAPLGTIQLDTHRAPVLVVARVDELRLDEAEAIARDPAVLERLEAELVADAKSSLRALALPSVLAALAGGVAAALASSLAWRSLVIGAVVSTALVGVGLAATVTTWRAEALAEPRHSGLLTLAPKAVGGVESLVQRFGEYRAQLTKLVENVINFYGVGQTLPTFDPSRTTVRMLHVSDIHLNPQAFDLMERVITGFEIDAVVDTGDTTDWGSEPEAGCWTPSPACPCRTCGCGATTTLCERRRRSPPKRTAWCSTVRLEPSPGCGCKASATPGTPPTSPSRSGGTSSGSRRRPPRHGSQPRCAPPRRRPWTSCSSTMLVSPRPPAH